MIKVMVGRIMMAKVFCLLIAAVFFFPLLTFEQAYADNRAVIKSASEPDYPPFCIVSPDGKADGFSVELLRAALTAVNLHVAFKIGPWDAIKAELRDGGIQVLPLVGRTPEREAIYDFTFPYLTLHGAIFVKKGDTRINTVSDLADKTVVVMRGDNAEEFARRSNISKHIVAVDSFKQAMELLDAGKYDAVIAQRLMGLQLLHEIKIKNVVPLNIVLNDFRQDFCFAVRAGDKALLSKLNEGLAIIIANGTFDQIHKKWFAPHIQLQITLKDVWKYVLYIMAPVLIATTLLSIALLRREVKRKTRSLVKEIAERKQAEESVARSLKEKEVLLKEIHHRVKNNMQVIHSLLNLQANSIADATVRAILEEARDRVHMMALIHQKLYQSKDLAHIDYKEYLQTLVTGIADTYQRRDVVVTVDMESVFFDVTVGIPCGLIVNELLSNSLKYAFPDGRKGTVKVGINKDGAGNNVLTVADNGVGFSATVDFRNSTSLGLQLVNVLAGQIHGKIELLRDEGTTFRITFPGTTGHLN